MVAFVPVSRDALSSLTTAPIPGPVAAFGVTPALCDTFSLPPTADEEAERTALLIAAVSSLISYGSRLVLVVEATPAADDEGGLGECSLPGVQWRDVSAIFAESSEAQPAVTAAAAAVEGLDLDAAWDAEPVQELMTEHDLLWYGPEEVGALLGP